MPEMIGYVVALEITVPVAADPAMIEEGRAPTDAEQIIGTIYESARDAVAETFPLATIKRLTNITLTGWAADPRT